ncbi:MAG: hypothetical protein A3F91_09910 [Flavobacteria bacterium RIFCSPLOWO2_12_FULL_35_11]|nr:MAG: hypothetical protein A3F91_09910 [Flavobacteria bacterium RIFCSPLOWO2_12_FULL_35_11]
MLKTIENRLNILKDELASFKNCAKYKLYQHGDALIFCVDFIIFSNQKEHIKALPEKELKKIEAQILTTIKELKSLRD